MISKRRRWLCARPSEGLDSDSGAESAVTDTPGPSVPPELESREGSEASTPILESTVKLRSAMGHKVRLYGEGNGNPLQYSCLENPMDGGAWWATVHGSQESDTTERLHSLQNMQKAPISSVQLALHCLALSLSLLIANPGCSPFSCSPPDLHLLTFDLCSRHTAE